MSEPNAPLDPLAVYTFADKDLFGELDPGARAQFEQRLALAEYPSGHIFYAPEEGDVRLYHLRAGRVRIYKLSPEGRALTLLILEPSSLFGEMALNAGWQHDSFAEALTDCSVAVIRRDDMRRLLNAHPAVALSFMAIMSRRMRALERKLADIAFKSVPQRLATVLVNLAGRAGLADDQPGVVRYTHQQLAEMIGSYRETVTKAIGEFREAGLIRVEEDLIFLTNLPRLRELMAGKS